MSTARMKCTLQPGYGGHTTADYMAAHGSAPRPAELGLRHAVGDLWHGLPARDMHAQVPRDAENATSRYARPIALILQGS